MVGKITITKERFKRELHEDERRVDFDSVTRNESHR